MRGSATPNYTVKARWIIIKKQVFDPFIVFIPVHEIDFIGVHNHYRKSGLLLEKIPVTLFQIRQVFVGNILLVFPASFGDILPQIRYAFLS